MKTVNLAYKNTLEWRFEKQLCFQGILEETSNLPEEITMLQRRRRKRRGEGGGEGEQGGKQFFFQSLLTKTS